MPYIDKDARQRIEEDLHPKEWPVLTTPGELNYVFSVLAKRYLELKTESYQTYNDIIGALEGCKLEMYRRRVSGYEDKKRWKSGDVWEEPDTDPAVDTWGNILSQK